MLISDYNHTLRENKETEMTFLNPKSPVLFLRKYTSRINYDEKLVIPYYVNDYTMGDSWKDDSSNTFSEVYSHTFTTVVSMRTKDLDVEDELTVKKTTYHGEQCLEIGPFTADDVGVRVFTIKCIQDDGTGSAVQYFKVLIEDPDDEPVTVDLSTLSEGQTIESSFDYGTDPNDGDSLSNASSRNVIGYYSDYKYYKYNATNNLWKWGWVNNGYRLFKQTILADYAVSVEYENGVPVRVKVVIDQDPDTGLESDKGYLYREDPRAWFDWKRFYYTGTPITAYTPTQKKAIGGTYYLTTYVEDNGVVYKLLDYVGKNPDEIPYCVILAAINNKVALTHLCNAAKAFGGDHKVILKLPQMPIVFDYRKQRDASLSALTGTISDFVEDTDKMNLIEVVDTSDVDIPNNINSPIVYLKYYESPRTVPSFPDRFTLDLGGSTVYVLQSGMENGILFSMTFNFDTHLVNGSIRGIFKGLDYGKYPKGLEFPTNTVVAHSSFCTYDNIDSAYAQGYDAWFCDTDDVRQIIGVSFTAEHARRFTTLGYIDYSGNLITSNKQVNDGDVALRCNYDESCLPSYVNFNVLGSVFYRLTGACIIAQKTSTESSQASSGNVSKDINNEFFVHYYRYNGSMYVFLKTEKLHDFGIIIPPKGTTHIFISTWGTKTNWKIGNHQCLDSGSVGMYMHDICTPAWCSGYINCTFHNNRTSILNNETCYWCYMTDCKFWDLGSGRSFNDGGYSKQGYLVDMEDGSLLRDSGFFMDNCENVYGTNNFQVHGAYDLCLHNCRGFSVQLDKIVFGCSINDFSGAINEGPAYSVPIRYDLFTNTMLNRFRNSKPAASFGPVGNANLEVMLSNSSVYTMDGSYLNKIYTNNFNKVL